MTKRLSAWAREMIRIWSKDDEWVRVHVLGKKPRPAPTHTARLKADGAIVVRPQKKRGASPLRERRPRPAR